MAKFEFESQMEIYKKLLEEAEVYEKAGRYEQALSIYLNAEKIVKKYGSKIERGNIIHRKGRVLAQKGNLRDALNAFKECLKFLKKGGGNALQIANINEAIGDAYKINGLVMEALSAYQDSLKILKDENERVLYTHSHLTSQILETIAKQLSKIGEIYLTLGDYDKALECCRESLKISLDTKSSSMILKSRVSISKILSERGDFKASLEYLLKSFDIAKKDDDIENLLNIILEIANIYKIDGDNKTALKYYNKALKLSKKSANDFNTIKILYKIGIIYLEKKSKKKSLEFLKKSYERGREFNQYYCDFILYQLGVLHYLSNNYERAYENLKESLKLAEKNNNRNLILNVLTKIGDIWKIKNNYDDSIYYYKKALEYVNIIENEIKILNKIGIANLLTDKIEDANSYLFKSYFLIQIILMLESNSDKKEQIIEKFFEVSQYICAVKCAIYEKTKDRGTLKEAIGYAEYKYSYNNSNPLINSSKIIESQAPNKIQTQINQKLEDIRRLLNNYQLERDQNSKEALYIEIKEKNGSILKLLDKFRELGTVGNYSQSIESIIDKLFKIDDQASDSWIILDFIYVKEVEILYIFLIDMKNKDLQLFSKEISEKSLSSIKNKIKKLRSPGIQIDKIKADKIIISLNNLWNKLVPKSLTKSITEQNYECLTIVAHSFLGSLPWETMLIKKQPISELFRFQQSSDLYSEIFKNLK